MRIGTTLITEIPKSIAGIEEVIRTTLMLTIGMDRGTTPTIRSLRAIGSFE